MPDHPATEHSICQNEKKGRRWN